MCIPARDFVAVAGGPNNIWIRPIGDSEAGLATAHRVIPACFPEVNWHAGTAHVPVVLHVAVEVIRNLVIDIDVIHLPDRQIHAMEAAAMNCSDVHAAVVGNHEAVGVVRINPYIVIVATPGNLSEVESSVEGSVE